MACEHRVLFVEEPIDGDEFGFESMNAATRFISPTKTPESLDAGLPVVSTPIADVVRTDGDLPSVGIAAEPEAFVAARELALAPVGWTRPRTSAWPGCHGTRRGRRWSA